MHKLHKFDYMPYSRQLLEGSTADKRAAEHEIKVINLNRERKQFT